MSLAGMAVESVGTNGNVVVRGRVRRTWFENGKWMAEVVTLGRKVLVLPTESLVLSPE